MKISTIIYEGVDRSGKDSIRMAVDKRLDYEFININRGPIGYEAYNRIFKKGQDSDLYKDTMRRLDEFSITVFIHCRNYTLRERMILTNEVLRGCSNVEESLEVMMERQDVYFNTFNEAKSSWGDENGVIKPLRNLFVVENDGLLEEAVDKIVDLLKSSRWA